MVKLKLDLYDILEVNQITGNNCVITQEAYENCATSIIDKPIIFNGIPIGVVTSLDEATLFEDLNWELIPKDFKEKDGITIIHNMELTALNLTNKIIK